MSASSPTTPGCREQGRESAGPIRLAFVVPSFDVGGVERSVARLVNHLDPSRFSTIVISLDRCGDAVHWIDSPSVIVFELQRGAGRGFWETVRRLGEILEDNRIDIVHSHNWGALVESAWARRMAGVPVHVHAERGTVLGSLENRGLRMKMRGAAASLALRQATTVISNSQAVADRVSAWCYVSRQRIHIIPNGVPQPCVDGMMNGRQAVRDQLGIRAGQLVLGSVGRLATVKGLELAIETVEELLRQGVTATLILVGDGPQREQLERFADSRGLRDRILMVGQRADIGNWLAAMDIFLNTSHSEGMSQALVEAMAVGLPLVVSDVGENRRLVESSPVCGCVVPARSARDFAAAILPLIPEAGAREQFGRNAGRKYREHYGLERMVAAYETLYVESWERRRRRADR